MPAAEVESQKSITSPGQDPGIVTANIADPQMVTTEDTMIEITEKIPNTDEEVTVKIETVLHHRHRHDRHIPVHYH